MGHRQLEATDTLAVTEPDRRRAYFDAAGAYTPYLATAAGGALFLVKTEDKHIARSLFSKQGRGELGVLARAVKAIEGLLGKGAIAETTLVDVGANIGTTTVPALLSHGFGAAVALEPEPANVRLLRLNALLNDVEDRVTVLPVAASNQVGSSELFVDRSRGGKHWLATDRGKLAPKQSSDALIEVETVTLDHLVATGVLEPERIGLIWMDAEAHEGHILDGASSLLSRGIPLVLEWNPVILSRLGDPGLLERAITGEYTHVATLHRDRARGRPSFPLWPVGELRSFGEWFLEYETNKTDVLVLRLDPNQGSGIRDLDAVLKASAPGD